MAAGCERLVHPCVAGEPQRRTQRRFIGVTMAAPFLAAGAAVTLSAACLGADMALLAIFATFGSCWFVALLVSSSGSLTLPSKLAAGAASIGLACLIAVAGGLASPVALLALALPVEAAWVFGTRRAVIGAAVAATIAIVLQFALAPLLPLAAASPAAWHWLIPIAWGLSLVPRMAHFDLGREAGHPAETSLEDVIDAVVLRFARTGEVLEASAKAELLLGLSPDLLAGTGLFDRVHIADRVAYLSALADLREGADLRRLELRLRMPRAATEGHGDQYRPFALDLMRAGDSDTFLALLRANGELAGLRDELAAAREAAAGADVAKGRFLAAVSHELRTPLNAILGFSDMLLHEMFGPFKDERQKEYVGLVRESGQHLLDVVTSILDVSRIEAGTYRVQPEPFRFADAVEMCQSMMRHQAGSKDIALDANLAADLGEINADRRAVQQILINLVSNAVKFTPAGGSVTVDARRVGSRLHFAVSDTGIGIAEHDLASLGKPFMQIQNDYTRRFEGTGLGLSLVKGLVALHEGTMSIESAPGEGTKVSISLPLEGPKQAADEPVVLSMPARTEKRDDSHGTLRKTA
ncbi:MAG: sensor histidine kinase [Mesorhizobium sp.]